MEGSYEDLIRSMSDDKDGNNIEAVQPQKGVDCIQLRWGMAVDNISNPYMACQYDRVIMGQHFKRFSSLLKIIPK